jgi:lipoprotein-anchoring transpeptidase ErfK/SrfK
MKRAALVAGVSVVALVVVGAAQGVAAPNAADAFWGPRSRIEAPAEKTPKHPKEKSEKASERSDKRDTRKAADKSPALPPGPLQIIVSIDKQRAKLFAGNVEVSETKISSGTPGHPTPMGVFTVIQKDRHHVSNLYDAPMPYMQRITWSGSALHEGPLPGRPASHGCVRLTTEFAQLLWKTTKIGARVIITRDDVAPVAIESERLFLLRPKVSQAEPPALAAQAQAVSPPQAASAPQPVQAQQLAAPIKTADAANTVPPAAVVPDTTRPLVSKVAANVLSEEPPAKLSIHHDGVVDGAPDPVVTFSRRILSPAPAATVAAPATTPAATTPAAAAAAAPAAPVATPVTAAIAAPIIVPSRAIAAEERPPTAPRPANNKPVSVFVSLKEHKLYVRQGWQSLFNSPVTIEHPERPIGTHVYTAIGPKADGTGMRWTVVTIPSSTKRATDDSAKKDGRKSRQERAEKPAQVAHASNASAALERIDIPPDVVERIGAMIIPGSSLIVSDNKLSDETGDTTDFIVLTP